MTYQGRELFTSPCLLIIGDEVNWKYSGNLIKQVKIVQVEKPKLLRRHPIYHVELSNGKTHDVRHDELFITKDEATQLSPTGMITARQSILTTASSQLDLACIGNQYLPQQIKLWESMNSEKFKLSNFRTAINSIVLKQANFCQASALTLYNYDSPKQVRHSPFAQTP
jgi:hypothetical protein